MDRGPPRVKNKAPAPLQISAEQILLEAFERKEEPLKVPKQRIADLEELQEFQGRKRKEYEDALRRNRLNIGQWMRYANWELEQKEYARARSVFERALDVDPTNVPLWVRYSESEMKNRNINHARNVLDRAVTTLPRVDKLWYVYVGMEETLGNIEGCRQVFERWMSWEPSTQAWQAYINMEKRYHEYTRARRIFERFTAVHPESENWIKWARFEDELASPDNVRAVYSLAIDTLNEAGPEFLDERILGFWAMWEARQKEWERAKAIYKFGLDNLARNKSRWLYDQYSKFEKQYGDREGIEDVILAKRRVIYEDQVKENPRNYDAWFSYLNLMEESSDDPEMIRDVFERAIANVPPSKEKRHWRRYIYLWIKYAVWEELKMKNGDRAKQVYEECIKLIPHKHFTFAKIWILYAKFELRQKNVAGFRKILGTAIGMCPKPKLFKGYIDLELKLKEFDRCRKLYEKFLESFPSSPQPWIEYGDLEQILGDQERARAIFELAISQNDMEMPELLWKRYIEFETEEGEFSRARNLYERLLDKTNHVKVWLSYALFEVSAPDNEDEYNEEEEEEEEDRQVSDEAKQRARKVFERAWNIFKERGLNEERVILLNGWRQFESVHGTSQDVDKVEKMKPRMVKKRRKLQDGSFQEYMDYLFPDDEEAAKSNVKFLQAAQEWKRKQLEKEQGKATENAS